MIRYIRLVIIAALIIGLGVWVGLSLPKDKNLSPGCDANLEWCFSDDNNVSLQVLSGAKALESGQTLANSSMVLINIKGINAEQLIGRITGVNMYMGQFDVPFTRQDGQWTGLTSMPSCVESQPMVWNIELFKASQEASSTAKLTPTNVHFTFSGQQN